MAGMIIERITCIIESIARGDFSNKYEASSAQDERIEAAVVQLTSNLKGVVKQLNLIAQGRYDVDFLPVSENDELGCAVSEMTEMLREMSNENKKSAWIKSGQAELSNIIRGDQDSCELGKNIVSFLARYINALVGTIYQVAMDSDDTLTLIGSFAFQNGKIARGAIKFGEGLIGQCALEKELLIFNDVPSGYMMISSSLGEVVPKHIIVIPFLNSEKLRFLLGATSRNLGFQAEREARESKA